MTFFKRSKFAGFIGEKNRVPDGVWMKCTSCKQPVYRSEVEENSNVCPACGFHFRMGARARLDAEGADETIHLRPLGELLAKGQTPADAMLAQLDPAKDFRTQVMKLARV